MTAFRTGYNLEFGERQAYLNTLYHNIKDKSKVLSNKSVTTVELSESGVTVKCEDGSSYVGDILAGADGVRSKVREEMWRLANSEFPQLVEHDKNGISRAISYPSMICINDSQLFLQSTSASLVLHLRRLNQYLATVIMDTTKTEARLCSQDQITNPTSLSSKSSTRYTKEQISLDSQRMMPSSLLKSI